MHLLDDKRLVTLVHKTEHSYHITTLALNIAKVVRHTLEDHLGTALVVSHSTLREATGSHHK